MSSMDWLERYATGYHGWKQARHRDTDVFYRPLGIVEKSFDNDGTYHEGRADINLAISFEAKTAMSKENLRRNILLAWAVMRLRHALLSARATPAASFMDDDTSRKGDRFFVIQRPKDYDDAIRLSQEPIVFLDDYYSTVDPEKLFCHAQNTARTFVAAKSLVRLMVLPLETTSAGTYNLRFLFVIGHQISDGLTNGNWAVDFMRLLNKKSQDLQASIPSLIQTLQERLPVPQEDLYPRISGSRARQRWFWAITLVLRHVQKPLPAAFPNPLRFPNAPVQSSVPQTKEFDRVLDYSRAPPLNAATLHSRIGKEATHRLHRVCRQAGCSIGAGLFVLVGMVMMEMYEERFPDIPLHERQPFIGSFPINPRPFFDHKAEADSVVLAFADGVVLPFLPSHLDLEGRIKLLVRSAQRQLSRYQKRQRDGEVNRLEYMGPRGAGRILPLTYIEVIERANNKLPAHLRREFHYQRDLPKQPNPTLATCGVSSVGRSSPALDTGQYDLSRPLAGDELVADIRGTRQNVRPRDGEFLVGIWGSDESIDVNVSYDACAIDPVWAGRWREKFGKILERFPVQARL
ncbi:hypothetical protein VM1G_08813 [Cytospora mali]|uniref:Uncharacterized protein n=1 Tax=Cytospora mali TaxID=578113 RepID=A0A194WBM1_CYTMA|nr:hypothetical protein VM1G_08813 [Valsa mali]